MQQGVEDGDGYGGEVAGFKYDDMFPALPESANPASPALPSWVAVNNRMRVGTSHITQVSCSCLH